MATVDCKAENESAIIAQSALLALCCLFSCYQLKHAFKNCQ